VQAVIVKGNVVDVWVGSKCVKKNTPPVQKNPEKSTKGILLILLLSIFMPPSKVVIPAPDRHIRGQAPAGIKIVHIYENTGFPFSRE